MPLKPRKPKLKPCPFCGVMPDSSSLDRWFAILKCKNPKCYVAPGVSHAERREAIRRWNRRAPLALLLLIILPSIILPSAALAADWPPAVVYDGQARDPAWLERAWGKLANRIVLADGRFFHLDAPQREAPKPGEPSAAAHHVAKLVKALPDGTLYVQLRDDSMALAALPPGLDPTLKPGDVLLLTASGKRPPALAWLAFPAEPRPITRAQFVEAIRAGLQLFYTQPCQSCNGKGYSISLRYGPGERIVARDKHPCTNCNGTGLMPLWNIRR